MPHVKTLEEDLKSMGLIAEDLVESSQTAGDDDVVDDDAGDGDGDDDSVSEQFRIARKAKRRRRRPKKRLKAAEKARQKISSRKRRRTAGGRKAAKLRGKALKIATKRGIPPGRVSIITKRPKKLAASTDISRIDALIESLASLSRTTALAEEANELRQAFERAIEVAQIVHDRFTEIHPEVSASVREEIEGILEDLNELAELSSQALEMVLEGDDAFVTEDGDEVELSDVLDEVVDTLSDYVESVASFEDEV